ncbi:hypothetical protein N7510_003306 [Penicillium lagena]|uniref:uncharacterized protein n=1 Tax=Penicillium lagena TaxID=94218 RepID=UPI0025418B62|nr:uncharacterized protein N7510_003306 [Penicillium lagena]KAJ5619322.1 hypothetical protein N7510_003306 [Penicillium lagena]
MLRRNFVWPFLALASTVWTHPSLTEVQTTTPEISITQVNSSTRWVEGRPDVQLFDIVLNNTGTESWLTTSDNLHVWVESENLQTVQPAKVKRIRPGDSVIVQVSVQNNKGVPQGSTGPATAVAHWGKNASTSLSITARYGMPTYNATAASVDQHESPDWFRDAKYGIFIHWGLYSVPAWGGVGKNENYAEWYWSSQMSPDDPTRTYQYHLKNYGPKFLYDDFMANFTAEKFKPKDWVDLIADAGAKYLVPVTKHHDGYALFDMPETVSKRNSVKQSPHRDFLREIFDAAKTYQPTLRRGTYFSMPEWFNPAFSNYTWLDAFGVVPYTGFVPVEDFIPDIQFPQMQILAYEYETDIMWCDITMPTSRLSPKFASEWINREYANNRQVTVNSRCGVIVGDFDTSAEYASTIPLSTRHFEATRGLDPHSFGYNAATPDSAYLNASGIVTTLIDTVSKNGNLLLDIGPKGDGSIPDIMQTNLREAGVWIKAHEESIFGTKYWPNGFGQGDFRYTTTNDAFYIHIFSQPGSGTVVPDLVPYLDGDRVTVVGGSMHSTVIDAKTNDDGHLVLDVPSEVAMADKYTWTFKIEY